MAHELLIENGRALTAFIGQKPWHGLGQEVDSSMSKDIPAFITAAGLDWQVEGQQLMVAATNELMDMYAIKRKMPDGSLKLLTRSRAVGKNYHFLQNIDAFKWFEPFLQAGEADLNTAGALFGGSRIWVLAKLNRDPIEVVPNDIVEKYILLSHSHDGSLAVRVGFTPVRVCCANTLAAAHGAEASKLIRMRHSKSLADNMKNVRETMNLANQEFEATAQQYKLLANKYINKEDIEKYIKRVFEIDMDLKISTRQDNIINRIAGLVETGRGNDMAGVRGTWWAGFNAITEYLTWYYAKPAKGEDKPDSRLDALWFGKHQKTNERALSIAVDMAA